MRDPESGWMQLSAAEFALLWTAMGLGDPVLGVPRLGRTERRRAELVQQASRTLKSRDLGTVAEPARDLALMLRRLGEHERLVTMVSEGPESVLTAIAAATARGAAAGAARVDDEVRIGPVAADRLAGSLLDSLVPLPAGSGASVNLSVADLDSASAAAGAEGVAGFLGVLRNAGLRQLEANMVSYVFSGRYGGGRITTGGSSISWVDTPGGRYALRRAGEWITVTPVDPPRLESMAAQLR